MTSDVRECLIKLAATRESTDNQTIPVSLNVDAPSFDNKKCAASCLSTFKPNLSVPINRHPARKQTLEFSQLCVIVSPRMRTIDSATNNVGRVYPDLWRRLTQWLHVANVGSTECAGECRTLKQSPLSVSKFHPTLSLRSKRHFSVVYLRSSWKGCVVEILWPNRHSREIDVKEKRDKSHVYKIEIDSTKRKQLLPYANPNNDEWIFTSIRAVLQIPKCASNWV